MVQTGGAAERRALALINQEGLRELAGAGVEKEVWSSPGWWRCSAAAEALDLGTQSLWEEHLHADRLRLVRYIREKPSVENKGDAPITARCCALSGSAAEVLLGFLEGIFPPALAGLVLLTMLRFISRTAPHPCVVGTEQGVPSPPLASSSSSSSLGSLLNVGSKLTPAFFFFLR